MSQVRAPAHDEGNGHRPVAGPDCPGVWDVSIQTSPFPPIADYAFLSDCETCALVAPSGARLKGFLPRLAW